MYYLHPKLDTPIKVRLRGHDDGGWRGNPELIGFATFTGKSPDDEGMPEHVKLNIDGAGVTQLKLKSLECPEADDGPHNMNIGVAGYAPTGEARQFLLAVHKDWVKELVPAFFSNKEAPGEANNAVTEVGKYSTADVPEVGTQVEPPKAKHVEYTPDEADAKLIALWGQMTREPGYQADPRIVRTVAVAVLRTAVKRACADTGLHDTTTYPRVVSRRALAGELKSICHISGLARFAHVGSKAISIQKPTEGQDLYDWGRMVEQWIAPITEMKIEALEIASDACCPPHASGDVDFDEGLKEALGLIKRIG